MSKKMPWTSRTFGERVDRHESGPLASWLAAPDGSAAWSLHPQWLVAWSTTTFRPVAKSAPPRGATHACVATGASGASVLVFASARSIEAIDGASLKVVWSLAPGGGQVERLDVTAGGALVAVTLRRPGGLVSMLIDADTGVAEPGVDGVGPLAVSPTRRMRAEARADGNVAVIDTAREKTTLFPVRGVVTQLALGPNDASLVVASLDDPTRPRASSVTRFNLGRKRPRWARDFTAPIDALGWSDDGTHVLVDAEAQVVLNAVDGLTQLHRRPPRIDHAAMVRSSSRYPRTATAVMTFDDTHAYWRSSRTLEDLGVVVHALALSPTGAMLAVVDWRSGAVLVFDAVTDEVRCELGTLSPRPTAIAWTPDGRLVLAVVGGRLVAWDAEEGYERWQVALADEERVIHPATEIHRSPDCTAVVVVLGGPARHLMVCVDLAMTAVRWTIELDTAPRWVGIDAAEGRVWYVSRDGTTRAAQLSDGDGVGRVEEMPTSASAGLRLVAKSDRGWTLVNDRGLARWDERFDNESRRALSSIGVGLATLDGRRILDVGGGHLSVATLDEHGTVDLVEQTSAARSHVRLASVADDGAALAVTYGDGSLAFFRPALPTGPTGRS